MKNKHILIIEDDEQISNFICYILDQEEYSHQIAKSGKSALSILRSEEIDLILLDLGLPDMDGMEIIKQVRKASQLPIIVVSARDQDKEKVEALDTGADDYLTKPFSVRELSARIRVAFRHSYIEEDIVETKVYQVKDLKMDMEKHMVFLDNKKIHVTPLEYSLLKMFFQNTGKVLTTQNILREVYGVSYSTDTQALRTLVKGLRKKIEKNPGKPNYILTEIGVGYRMLEE